MGFLAASGVTGLFGADAVNDSVRLTARLVGPREARVEWTDPTPGIAGHIVEFINHPTDRWVILGFVPATRHGYVHPRLAPDTPYSYRVRAFFGPTTYTIAVTVASGVTDTAYAAAFAQPEDYSWAAPQTVPDTAMRRQASVQGVVDDAAAAPTGLAVELMPKTVSGFRFSWTDHAANEEGFLLERVEGGGEFTVAAVLAPNINRFGWALEPPQRTARFRVRAYCYGPASEVVTITTGPDSGEKTGTEAVRSN